MTDEPRAIIVARISARIFIIFYLRIYTTIEKVVIDFLLRFSIPYPRLVGELDKTY